MILPGDTLILDCYYTSSERNFTTIGGESAKQEMCFDFFMYYPAVDFIRGISAKAEEALNKWMFDAQTNGYLTGDISSAFINEDWDSLHYDYTMDGSLEFYNRLWDPEYPEYDQNHVYCVGSNNTIILYDIRPQPTGFVEYYEDVFTCDGNDSSTGDIDSKAQSILEHSLFIITIVGSFGFMIM